MTAVTTQMYGSPTKVQIGEKTKPVIGNRLFAVERAVGLSTHGPTETSKDGLQIINTELGEMMKALDTIDSDIIQLAKKIYQLGGPLIEGIKVK